MTHIVTYALFFYHTLRKIMSADALLWKYSFLFVLIRLMDFNENETLHRIWIFCIHFLWNEIRIMLKHDRQYLQKKNVKINPLEPKGIFLTSATADQWNRASEPSVWLGYIFKKIIFCSDTDTECPLEGTFGFKGLKMHLTVHQNCFGSNSV